VADSVVLLPRSVNLDIQKFPSFMTTSSCSSVAMQSLFGEEITPQHILLFDILKRVVVKWRSQAAQRKNIIAAEHFAANEVQKKAILKHKEQAMITVS